MFKNPMSFAQTRLWFLNQYISDKSVYNIFTALRFEGRVDIKRLEDCINTIVAGHEILRTTFGIENDIPVQKVAESMQAAFEVHELKKTAAGNEKEIRQCIERFSYDPFDLASGPLIRFNLLKIESDLYVLVISMHHIISDGWSLKVLVRELTSLYINGAENFQELPIQYIDYTEWQRELIQGEKKEKLMSYWKEQLRGLPSSLKLPTDFERPLSQNFMGHEESFTLSPGLSAKLKSLSHYSGASLYMTVLSAYAILISRYTGENDIAIGSPIANRNRKEMERLIGFFVNTLVLRIKVNPQQTFLELLGQVKNNALEAYKHQDLAFEEIVDALQPDRHVSHSPLFQVFFAYHNANDAAIEVPGVKITPVPVQTITSKFELSLFVEECREEIKMKWEYSSALFKKDTILRLSRNLETLLESITNTPGEPVKQINGIAEKEKQQLLELFNNTSVPFPSKTITGLFEEQVLKTPDHTAVVFEGTAWSYSRLNEMANRLANYLCDVHKVRAGCFIGIMLERSEWTIISVLAVLKSGATCVPIDTDYPGERVRYIMSDAGCSVLIDEKELEIFNEGCDRFGIQNLQIDTSENDPLYALYTSGSTGEPKGVVMAHKGLKNLILHHYHSFNIPCSSVLQFASTSFDVSFQEIFFTLLGGGSLFVIPKLIKYNPLKLFRFISDKKIEIVFFPTAYLKQLMNEEKLLPMMAGTVKHLIIAGEQLVLTEGFIEFLRNNNIVIHNHYGPTESHVVTAFTIQPGDNYTAEIPPIGKPISNTRIYILDEHRQIAPIGACGEIYIGGDGLSIGYLNKPELTNEKFIENPFRQGDRLYQTGDLGKWLSDGTLEYAGRKDNQVKIRGYRIEPGEVESILLNYKGIESATVLAKTDHSGEKILVAYVAGKYKLSNEELRDYLKKHLPEYMLPSHFIQLQELPLNTNGKIDKKALPELEERSFTGGYRRLAPRNRTEEKLADIWSEVLKLDRAKIGVRDDFFKLGGNSLKTIKVISRINSEFNVDINIQNIFKEPTIESLRESIDFICDQTQRNLNKEGLIEISL